MESCRSSSDCAAMPDPATTRKWYPPTGPAGARIINDQRRFLLVTGPRKFSKTFTICQKAAIHAYAKRKAEICFITKRRKTGEFGAWVDFTRHVVENQFQVDGGILPWIRRPASTSNSKHTVASVRNAFGGESRVHLWSLYRDADVEVVFKQTRFSFIYVCEADQFTTKAVFRAFADQLRVPGMPYEDHQLIMDCNPPEEGMDHWLAKVFPVDPDDWECAETAGEDDPEGDEYRKQFGVHRMTLDDNPFLSRRERLDIVNAYRSDPDKYRRYVLGEWIRSSVGTEFESHFDSRVHVIGFENVAEPEEKWDVLMPPRGTFQIATAWDLGGVHHAVEFGVPWLMGKMVAISVIDEVVSFDLEIPLRHFVDDVLKKMDRWEKILQERGCNGSIEWNHWSDTSAFNFTSSAEKSEAAIVMQHSNNRIVLRRVTKGRDSVDAGLNMMKRMFSEGLLHLSPLCRQLVLGLKVLKPGDFAPNKRHSGPRRRFIHPLDAARYLATHEVPRAMTEMLRTPGANPSEPDPTPFQKNEKYARHMVINLNGRVLRI